ncbi:hypothetical protein [Pseudomonas sp. H3(2019)]|uniref:hypothetical protein n=1 Tax=Pseudomonas sp. H3(2019) TaxID=2598724 RepID=UPI001194FA83|nr:hypothetical protein [Pseudomonas sp. H3(2019)]TVT79543.1 hypothetical protein FPT12_25765 [Pseudomonas sp. H3(2019)]
MNIIESKIGQIPSRKQDWFAVGHFCVWLVFGTIFYLGDELDRLFGLWLLLIPLLAIPALIASGTFAIGLVANLWARRWRRLVSVVAAPVVTIGLLAASIHYQINPDWIHFQLTRDHYTELARNLPGPSPKYHEWSWGGTGGAVGPNIFYGLVYDETDKPLNRPEEPGHKGVTSSARPYGRHFFLITEIFQ